MPLYTIRPQERWQELLEEMAQQSGMATALTDATGAILQTAGGRFPLCQAIRDDKDSLTSICSQTNSAMLAQLKQLKRPLVEQCEAGLLRLVIPVLQSGELVGQLTACGLAGERDDVEVWLIARQLGLNETQVEELARQTTLGLPDELLAAGEAWFQQLSAQ